MLRPIATIASATFYAAGGDLYGLKRGYASNSAGIIYAAAILWIVNTVLGGGALALSVIVGVFMSLAILDKYVPVLSYTPGGFLGYTTMFSVHAITRARSDSPVPQEKPSPL